MTLFLSIISFLCRVYTKFQCNLIIQIGILHKAPSSSVVKILNLHRVRYEYNLTITSRPLHIRFPNYLFRYLSYWKTLVVVLIVDIDNTVGQAWKVLSLYYNGSSIKFLDMQPFQR